MLSKIKGQKKKLHLDGKRNRVTFTYILLIDNLRIDTLYRVDAH